MLLIKKSIFLLLLFLFPIQSIPQEFYFPLDIGNKWFYKKTSIWGNPIGIQDIWELKKDILLNGKKYYQIEICTKYTENPDSFKVLGKILFRASADTLYAHYEMDFFNPPLNEGFICDSNSAMKDSLSIWGYKYKSWYFGRDFAHHIISDSLGFSYYNSNTWKWHYTTYLVGCIIDGKIIGETIKDYVVSAEMTNNLPMGFSLSQNYPNPFNPTTTIKYSIPIVETRYSASPIVLLKIYDVLGSEIATLVNEEKAPGNYEVVFNGANLPSGIYFYKMSCGNFSETKKLVLMK